MAPDQVKPMQMGAMGQQQQAPQAEQGATNGAAQQLIGVAGAVLKVGMHVDAQCVGWGPEWYPGVIRELLIESSEVQVLWDGDDPSISNVPPQYVKPRGQPAPGKLSEEVPPGPPAGVPGGSDGKALQPSSNTAGEHA